MSPAALAPKLRDQGAIAQLWRKGVVGKWKYDSTEVAMRDEIEKVLSTHDQLVCLAGRRTGKTFIWATMALEYALTHPNAQIKYISSTTDSIKEYLIPTIEALIEDCPADVRPRYIKGESAFRFWNGARIRMFGTDAKNFRKLRGQAANFTIVDECGFMADLETTITSVLNPQSLRTGGKVILSSSAPDEPGHYFTELVYRAREEGNILERTIYQRLALGSKRQTPAEEAEDNAKWLAKAIKDSGGEHTTAFRREYLNDLGATDDTRAALPYFTDALCKGNAKQHGVVRTVKTPRYCHKYVSIDLGFIDQSACLGGFLVPGNMMGHTPEGERAADDAPAGALVITDELVLVKKLSEEIVGPVVSMERNRWGAEEPLMRIVDGQPENIERLQRAGLKVYKTRNDKPDAAIDEVQSLLTRGLLIIDPRCVLLKACMQAAVWKKAGDRLDRHPKHGHFDLLMALAYMVRNIRRYADPFPYGHNAGPGGPDLHGAVSETVRALRAGFKNKLPW